MQSADRVIQFLATTILHMNEDIMEQILAYFFLRVQIWSTQMYTIKLLVISLWG